MAEPAPAAPQAPPVESLGAAAAPAPLPARVLLVDEPPFRGHVPASAQAQAQAHAHAKKHGRHARPYHPAPGIIVDVTGAQGGAPAADLQRAARNLGYWPFRACYEEGLRRDQHLSGKVSLDVAIAPSGAVDRSVATASTLRDDSVVACVAREAQHLALPAAESPATARIDVSLATGDEPVPLPHPAPHADELREGLRASWPAVEQCYARELGKRPDVGGRLELRFRIQRTGEIDEVAEGDTRFADVDVTRCVLGVYRTARLPPLPLGQEVSFTYALHFEAMPEGAVASLQKVSPAAK
jgi:hypothetical protein